MATDKTVNTQDIHVDVPAYLAAASNDDVVGDTKLDSTGTTAAQVEKRPGANWGNTVDDNTLANVYATDKRAKTTTTDATVTTIKIVQKFSGGDEVIAEDEMWRLEVTLQAIEGADSAQTLWQRRVWHVFGRAADTADVVENDGPHITGANLVGAPGLTLDLTGGKMTFKVTGLAATTINWEILYFQRVYNEQ